MACHCPTAGSVRPSTQEIGPGSALACLLLLQQIQQHLGTQDQQLLQQEQQRLQQEQQRLQQEQQRLQQQQAG
jgi:hemerythrin-like domain-containing protein